MPQPEQLPDSAQTSELTQGAMSRRLIDVLPADGGGRGRARTPADDAPRKCVGAAPVIESVPIPCVRVGELWRLGGLSESERDLLLKGTMGRTRGIRRTA